MFVLCDGADHEPLKPMLPDQPWKCLVPFFEHANIASEATYDFYKRVLCRKALSRRVSRTGQ